MILYIVELLVRFWLWLQSWFVRKPRRLTTIYLEELPDAIAPGAVYVLGEGRSHWFAALACPCGCGAIIQVSLLPDSKPYWRLIEHANDGTISLEPSIWRENGCQSHFFLRHGLIQWCGRG